MSSSYVLDVPYSLFIGTDGYLLHILRGIEREKGALVPLHMFTNILTLTAAGGGGGGWKVLGLEIRKRLYTPC